MTPQPDWRNIRNGFEIPTATYADQPYVVRTDDGAWLCVLTTGSGREGEPGQGVVSLRSDDCGRTWSPPVPLEPPGGPEASFAVPVKVPSGRIYCFYNHNTDDLRAVSADDPPYPGGLCPRVDSLGYYVFRYSDDHGRSWSNERHVVPVRAMAIDRANPYQGRIRFFWNVGKPFVHRGAAYVPLHKVGGFGRGFFTRSEGVLLKSDDLLTAQDPRTICWETLPDGERGLHSPAGGGPIAEEQSAVALSDGSFFCVYRTVDGHPACSYSRDGGHTWEPPEYLKYAEGRLVKHPRAANFVWKCANGRYLYWFHNHGGRDYADRNPAWLSGGVEVDSPTGKRIAWSQPEIFLYDDDPYIRISYPDLIEDGARRFVTETQKATARVHEIDARLLAALWGQFEAPANCRDGLLWEREAATGGLSGAFTLPDLPALLEPDPDRADYGTRDLRRGFSIEVSFTLASLAPGQVLLDNRNEAGAGFCVEVIAGGRVQIRLGDGRSESVWCGDPDRLQSGRRHHLVVSIDGGPKVITFVLDGQLDDGGRARRCGWGRYNPNLRSLDGGPLRLAPALQGALHTVKLYGRALLTSEAIGNYRVQTLGGA
ncbi:MAG TPA: LamG-like jellyroll fold domain-containing protein [Limnochordia bacterium]|nr:LamG-like jellyroll fold domain-containing protein [Limnochordia bacterium]